MLASDVSARKDPVIRKASAVFYLDHLSRNDCQLKVWCFRFTKVVKGRYIIEGRYINVNTVA